MKATEKKERVREKHARNVCTYTVSFHCFELIVFVYLTPLHNRSLRSKIGCLIEMQIKI